MSVRTLWILGSVALLLVIASLFSSGPGARAELPFLEGQPLVGGIDVDRVASIEIEGWGQETRLLRRKDGFVVVNRDAYPADPTEVNDLVRACLEVRCDALVTQDAGNHGELGVAWPGNLVKRVRFYDAEGKAMVGLVLSHVIEGRAQGHHVRLEDQDLVYRCDEMITVHSDPNRYLARRLWNVDRKDLALMQIEYPGGSYGFAARRAGGWDVLGIPDGMELRPNDKSYEFILVLSLIMDFQEFMPLSAAPGPVEQFPWTHSWTLRNGIQYVMKMVSVDDPAVEGPVKKRFYAAVRARFVAEEVDLTPNPDRSLREMDLAMRRANELAAARDEVQAFNERHAPWLYTLSTEMGLQLASTLDKYLQPK